MDIVFILLVGSVAGLTVSLFVTGVRYCNLLWNLQLTHDLAAESLNWSPYLAVSLLVAAVLAGQILKRLPANRQRGPADSLWAAHEEKLPEIKEGFASSLMGFINLCGGASVGIFGPTVHLGACLASFLKVSFEHFGFKSKLSNSQVIAAGAAAGLAALFIVPLGAMVFAFEGVLKRFSWRASIGVILASLASYGFSRWCFDRRSPLPTLTNSVVSLEYFAGTILFACICSLAILAYLHLMVKLPVLAFPKKIPLAYRPLIPAFLLFVISPWTPQLIGAGGSSAGMAMTGSFSLGLLVLLTMGKVLLTPFCFGFGFVGGVVGPALFIGAMLGAVFDQSGILGNSTHFALIGAAIGVGAVIGAPISACIMLWEMTSCSADALLALVGCGVAIPIIKKFFAPSLFAKQLSLRGLLLPVSRSEI